MTEEEYLVAVDEAMLWLTGLPDPEIHPRLFEACLLAAQMELYCATNGIPKTLN